MTILVYGAGGIGSVYAARLQRAGHDVSILARGHRLEHLRETGIELEDAVSGERTSTLVRMVERLEPGDPYELVLVALAKTSLPQVLPVLANNRNTPSVLFLCNNAEGHGPLVGELDYYRVLLGFPGLAAINENGVVRYVILSKREQPTTIGEPGGRRTPRIVRIAEAFEAAGFPSAICPNMDAWLKTHVAEISPTANALLMAGGDTETLADDPEALQLMLEAIREGYRVLHAQGVPITPSNHRIFEWLPAWLLRSLARRQLRSPEAKIKVGHARHALAEWKLLGEEFQRMARASGVETPAIDRLYEFVCSDSGLERSA